MRRLAFSFLTFLLFSFSSIYGSHIAGGSIQYSYTGPGTTPGTHKYEIRVGIYRWCAGANIAGTTQTITAKCTATGATQTFNIPVYTYVSKPGERPANQGKRDVSDLCRSKISRCHSTSGAAGFEELIFKGTITLGSCNSWEITSKTNKSASSFNSTGQETLRAIFNTNAYPVNSGPLYPNENKPLTNACLGQDIIYAIEAFDPDDDSLVYEMICPARSSIPGYKCATGLSGLKLDSLTGKISLSNPTTVGQFFISFWVKEYDRCNGNLKGQTERGILLSIRTCTNKIPKDISGISNLKGNATQTGRYSIVVCQGEKISWSDTIFDPDQNDSIHLRSNIGKALPGARMSTTYLSRNKVVVTFNWLAGYTKSRDRILYLVFDDNRCDFPGNSASVFIIKNNVAAYAGPDQTVCKGDSVRLSGTGGRLYTWRTISGDSLISGINWFPDTTANDTNQTGIFIPTKPTRIELQTDLKTPCAVASSCGKSDTILITPVDSFSLTIAPDPFLCNPASGQLNVTPSQSSLTYSYKWDNGQLLNNDSLKNPTFSNVLYPTRFNVTVTGNSGCVRESHVDVNVNDPFPKNMKVMASDTLVCISKQIKLWVDRGSVEYGDCKTPRYKCQGTFKDYTLGIGTDSNQTNTYNMPMTYGSYSYSQKSQYLYTASELKAMGMKPGPINSIAWEIKSLYNSTAAPFNKFSIKMGCSHLKDLPASGFVSGLKEVFTPKAVLPQVGWNTHQFDQEYSWDGTSNLVVEVCWDNITSRLNGQHIQTFDKKSYKASNTYYQQSTWNGSACVATSLSPGFPVSVLPRTRFNACNGIRSGLYKYSWEPKSNGGFIGATNKDSATANVNLGTAKIYTVYIEDSTYGVCRDTLSVKVNVVSSYDTKPDDPGKICIKDGTIQLTSKTPWNITIPGGQWTGIGIVNSKLGLWDPIRSGVGKHWAKYSVTGDRCASTDSIQIEVVNLPDVSVLGPDSLCGIYGGGSIPDTIRHRLTPKTPGGWFSGVGVDSTLNGSGKMVYYINGNVFNPTQTRPDTAIFNHKVSNGCVHDTTIKVAVYPPWDHSFLGVMDHGVPYQTVNFCVSSPQNDTLVVAGNNPTWEYIDGPTAMINKSVGAFNVRSLGYTRDTTGRIKVGNYGFCGTDTTITVTFIKAPEVEVLSKTYCKDFYTDPANFTRVDTLHIRIPKGPSLTGSTGKKDLDTTGFDPSTEVIVSYASIAGSGWPQAIDKVAGQYNYNFWDGRPWMRLPQVARYRIFSLPAGRNKISYNFGFRYRQTFPNKYSCTSVDSGFVEKVDSLQIALKDTYRICGSNTVLLDAGYYQTGKYKWSNGATNNSITVSKKGVYTVTVTTDYCRTTKQTVVFNGCVNVEEVLEDNVVITLFPNPASTFINLKVTGANNEVTELKIISLLGKEVFSTIMNTSNLIEGTELNVSQLQSGTYFFQIKNGESLSTYRVVIN